MNDSNESTLMNIIDSVGGADMFMWLVMFGILIVVAIGLYFFAPKQ